MEINVREILECFKKYLKEYFKNFGENIKNVGSILKKNFRKIKEYRKNCKVVNRYDFGLFWKPVRIHKNNLRFISPHL